MTARGVGAGLIALGLGLVAVGQLQAGLERMQAQGIVFSVQQLALAAARGEAPPSLLRTAVARLREARELDPTSIEVAAAQGDLYLLLERHEAAREAYLVALELEPRAEVFLNLGIVELELGRSAAGRGYVRKAVQLDRTLRPAARRILGSRDSDPPRREHDANRPKQDRKVQPQAGVGDVG